MRPEPPREVQAGAFASSVRHAVVNLD